MGNTIAFKLDGDDSMWGAAVRVVFTEALDALDMLVVDLEVSHQLDSSELLAKLKPGVEFSLDLMEDGTAVHSAVGDVVEVRHSRRPGTHRVTVVGLDKLHRLNHKQAQAEVWEVAHDDIASEIADRNSLTPVVEGVDGTAELELQNNESDGLFLRRLAKQNNYYLRVLDGELHFGRKEGSGAAVEVDMVADVLEISQRASLVGIITEVTVHGSNYVQDETFTGTASSSDLKNIGGGETGVSLAETLFGTRELILNQSGYVDTSTATARAKAELQARAEDFVRGTVIVNGNPNAVSGKNVTITGAGWPLDGTFLIRETSHVYDRSGYRTRIGFQSDSLPSAS